MPMRSSWLPRLARLLLLAVFFNAAIGMPLHEASHLDPDQGAARLAQEAAALDDHADTADDDAHEAAHGVCVWCLAHAPLAAFAIERHAVPQAAPGAALPRAPPGTVLAPLPGRWPFASRDPPPAST